MGFRRLVLALAVVCGVHAADVSNALKIRITWGEESNAATPYYVKLVPASTGLTLENVRGVSLESGETLQDGAWQTRAGAGDVDGVEFTLHGAAHESETLQNVQVIWADLIAGSDADTARRLSHDAAMHPQSPKLTVELNREATRGFSVTLDQLATEKAIWVPSLHVYITAGDNPVSFADHQRQLAPWKPQRMLNRLRTEAEATYEQYTAAWEDMGNPAYTNPQTRGPGHIVCLSWDSAIPKFGIDRGAGVWNDYGNPDHFQFWFDFGDIAKGITRTWKGQHLENGLPVITTTFEKDGIRYEVEQFAYPLDGPPRERRGDLDMLLLQRVRATELEGKARDLPVTFSQRRRMDDQATAGVWVEQNGDTALFRDRAHHKILFAVDGIGDGFAWNGTSDYEGGLKRVNGTVHLNLPAKGSREFIVKLASPMAAPEDVAKLNAIDYARAREETLRFWSDYVQKGAQFRSPDPAVNEMYRTSLWHALRLPRRHGADGAEVKIDLPYSNFAYSQTGTPWPVNQAVYVDYMLYDLRGYHGISAEELAAQFRNNQEYSGHINGLANWTVYTPGMLYAVAQNYLLSGDRTTFERLLPQSLKAMEWCLKQLREAKIHTAGGAGLVQGPLNDLTGEGVWAFNQAYMYAGLELFGRALAAVGNPKAEECRLASAELKLAIERGFGAATVQSPLVQLRDHTWQPYVPCEQHTPHRIMDQWYPTDVDTGAVHMIRLKAVAAHSEMADWLLNDHEDNLFYKGLGIANEPVYNQHATAYLLRDEPEAAIRTFYSLMASGFSQTVHEPVEHRWTHGQYFGPPSTDGAWFELYRNMLLREREDGALVIGSAIPRAWFAHGKEVAVERAPTYYGELSFHITSSANSGQIQAVISTPERAHPRELLIRFRDPRRRQIRSVTVNGRAWTDFDVQKEWIRIAAPVEPRYTIVASY